MPPEQKNGLLRQLPAVDQVMRWPEMACLLEEHPRGVVVDGVRNILGRLREAILNGEPGGAHREEVVRQVTDAVRPNLRPVINATGVVLHTNLGRAVLCRRAQEAVARASSGFTNLEFNLVAGKRGQRHALVEELLCRLTGAEAALVVNNNAAAVLLALSTLAAGREVIVSRGQLVEIGGSFRIPDVMRQSGAFLVEVGSTNKTHRRDYREAVNERTALLLHVHMSNYRIIGFAQEVPVAELVTLGREYNLPVVSDLGSGSLVDLSRFGLPYEPTVQEMVTAGADVITFSGDKLLGGPQAGLVVGRRDYIERMRKHPLARAVRIDKLNLGALEATLREYLDPEAALEEIPILRMLLRPIEELKAMAGELAARVSEALGEQADVWVEEGISQVGGGAMPTAVPLSALVFMEYRDLGVNEVIRRLRLNEPPVIARAEKHALALDVRTIGMQEIPAVVEALQTVVRGD
ncbi:MAG: L-seryl-tRNA(Sec) selenium transferase [Ammonifex sp.]|nr:MAG: L-seryl-tRNA(Sec) selenium transferase [Ammonifex sp.]